MQVSCAYPGANAAVVTDTLAAPIEQQVNGVDHLLYMQSQATNDGIYVLQLTFEVGADPNLALVQTQNRVQLAMPLLPEVVLEGQTGLLVPPGNPAALAEAMARIAGDRVAAARMGRAGRALVEEHFDVRRNVDQQLALLAH